MITSLRDYNVSLTDRHGDRLLLTAVILLAQPAKLQIPVNHDKLQSTRMCSINVSITTVGG